ncbi:MAG: N-acetylmuramoyl-L-alanine amidase [Deltaproteobacteria bacterium]|nr:N-acetylmuramoyl-L-alanine amidase [Deltaproteobacteria bacterium]
MNGGGQGHGIAPPPGGDAPVDGICQDCPRELLTVTVRRDFPLRDGELLGTWRWSSSSGTRSQDPMRWTRSFEGPLQSGEERPLVPREERPFFGWGIGRPALGSPGSSGGQCTTDERVPIVADVKLLRDSTELRSARTSGPDGRAELETTGLNGDFFVQILPRDRDDTPTGPGLPANANPPDLLYRSCTIRIRLRNGRLDDVRDPYDPPTGKTHCRVGNRQVWEPTVTHLPVSLKPVWWKHPGPLNRSFSQPDMIVIHCTSGARLGNALNRWFGQGSHTGPHYTIDIDGHVIKHVQESRRITHAGGRWEGKGRVDHRSVGIEIINPTTAAIDEVSCYSDYTSRGEPPYTPEQYRALIIMNRRILHHHPLIGHRIVGHSDVATGNATGQTRYAADQYGTKRWWDPGTHFQWERLEGEGLGMVSRRHFNAGTSYAVSDGTSSTGLFHRFPDLELREGDCDHQGTTTARYGGVARPIFSGDALEELQQDLWEIGYSLRVNGRFDVWTAGAVERFTIHFFSGTRGQRRERTVNIETARRIKDVVEEVRSAVDGVSPV